MLADDGQDVHSGTTGGGTCSSPSATARASPDVIGTAGAPRGGTCSSQSATALGTHAGSHGGGTRSSRSASARAPHDDTCTQDIGMCSNQSAIFELDVGAPTRPAPHGQALNADGDRLAAQFFRHYCRRGRASATHNWAAARTQTSTMPAFCRALFRVTAPERSQCPLRCKML